MSTTDAKEAFAEQDVIECTIGVVSGKELFRVRGVDMAWCGSEEDARVCKMQAFFVSTPWTVQYLADGLEQLQAIGLPAVALEQKRLPAILPKNVEGLPCEQIVGALQSIAINCDLAAGEDVALIGLLPDDPMLGPLREAFKQVTGRYPYLLWADLEYPTSFIRVTDFN